MEFPQYRKLINGQVVYKILDSRNFIEKQKIGSKIKEYQFEAKQYPDILRISDMLNNENEMFLIITEVEWNVF